MTWLAQWLRGNVTVQNAVITTDRFNGERLDWTDPEETVTPGYVQERSNVEATTDDQRTVLAAVAFVAADAPVLSTSRIVDAAGTTWDVTGVRYIAFAGRSHLEVKLSREIGV